MSKLSLINQYKSLVEDGKLNNDPYQKTTIAKLNELSEELSLKKENSFLSRLSNFERREKIETLEKTASLCSQYFIGCHFKYEWICFLGKLHK